jgi:hypothetical protein
MRPIVAGLVLARCRCCSEPQELQASGPRAEDGAAGRPKHPQLAADRLRAEGSTEGAPRAERSDQRLCPLTRELYLDRGDGVFEPTGARAPAPAADAEPAPDVLGDRPRRSDDKVRISLERATFAGEVTR